MFSPSLWSPTTGLLAWKPVNRRCTWWERSHSICSWKGTHLWWAIWCIVTQPRISCLHSEVVNDHFKTLRCSQWREAVEAIISMCFPLTQNAWNSLKNITRYRLMNGFSWCCVCLVKDHHSVQTFCCFFIVYRDSKPISYIGTILWSWNSRLLCK